MPIPEYEIYALKYAERMGTRGGIFMGGDLHDAPLAMDYFIWAIRSPERTIVVDLGFGREEGERRGRTFLRCPAEALSLIGIDAATVEDVVVTHMHYDHAGNLDKFPNARFHIQDTELAYVTGRAMTHKHLRHSFVLSDVIEMVSMVYGDRAVFHDGEDDLCPGIRLHPMPGHTRGLQSLTVNTARGTVIVASDAAHYYESYLKEPVFNTHIDIYDMLESYRRLRKLAPSDDHIIPGHDPEVLKLYPPPRPDLDGIIVRVDGPPNASVHAS